MKKKLEQAYKDYVALLEKALKGHAGYLFVHGVGDSAEDIQLGEELRAKIKELSAK
jgi:hypothetical protein